MEILAFIIMTGLVIMISASVGVLRKLFITLCIAVFGIIAIGIGLEVFVRVTKITEGKSGGPVELAQALGIIIIMIPSALAVLYFMEMFPFRRKRTYTTRMVEEKFILANEDGTPWEDFGGNYMSITLPPEGDPVASYSAMVKPEDANGIDMKSRQAWGYRSEGKCYKN